MNSRIMTWAMKASIKNGIAKAVLIRLAYMADENAGNLFPSIGHLHRVTSFDVKSVRKAVHELERDGFLRIETQFDHGHNGRQTSNRYWLILPGYLQVNQRTEDGDVIFATFKKRQRS